MSDRIDFSQFGADRLEKILSVLREQNEILDTISSHLDSRNAFLEEQNNILEEILNQLKSSKT